MHAKHTSPVMMIQILRSKRVQEVFLHAGCYARVQRIVENETNLNTARRKSKN